MISSPLQIQNSTGKGLVPPPLQLFSPTDRRSEVWQGLFYFPFELCLLINQSEAQREREREREESVGCPLMRSIEIFPDLLNQRTETLKDWKKLFVLRWSESKSFSCVLRHSEKWAEDLCQRRRRWRTQCRFTEKAKRRPSVDCLPLNSFFLSPPPHLLVVHWLFISRLSSQKCSAKIFTSLCLM